MQSTSPNVFPSFHQYLYIFGNFISSACNLNLSFVSALCIKDAASFCNSATVGEVTVIKFVRFLSKIWSKGYLFYSVKPSYVRNYFWVWGGELRKMCSCFVSALLIFEGSLGSCSICNFDEQYHILFDMKVRSIK
jgi:hypothetical protein